MGSVKALTAHNFDDEVLKRSERDRVLVDFWASWCGPCQMQSPVVEKLAERGYHVGMVNVDQQPRLAEEYGVQSVPTLMVFKNGSVENRMMGVQSLSTLEAALS